MKFIKIACLITLCGISSAIQAQLVVIVSSKSPATALTQAQASALFLGKSDQLPGAGPAFLVDLPESNPIREVFYGKLTGKSLSQVKASWARLVFSGKGTAPKEMASSVEVKKLVAENPNVIGYVEKSVVDSTVKVLLSVE